MYFANTHMHSTFSDGAYTPKQLVKLGKEIGHKAMLLTDHDTMTGQHEFVKAARREGILTMVATEITALCSFGRCHLVCVDFNTEDKAMRELLDISASCTRELTHYLVEEGLANGTMRKGITWQDVLDANPGKDYICNNHVFELFKEKGIYTQDEYAEFFSSNFGIPKDRKYALEDEIGYHHFQIEDAIDIVLKADGVPIIAHPTESGKYFFKEETENFIKMGVKGFEVCFPSSTKEQREFYSAVCDEKGLYKLGGTDHSSKLGGFEKAFPQYDVGPETGYIDEQNFMKLYRRELW